MGVRGQGIPVCMPKLPFSIVIIYELSEHYINLIKEKGGTEH